MTVCPALGIDYATLLIGLAAGIALGMAGVLAITGGPRHG
jgi:hypothetical protein